MKQALHNSQSPLHETLRRLLFFTTMLLFIQFTKAQSPAFWGTAFGGGPLGDGTIVKGDGNGNFSKVYEFIDSIGAAPVGNMIEINGGLYGQTYRGGYGDSCCIYRYDTTTGAYTMLYEFFAAIPNGWDAWGDLIRASDGNIWSTCAAGGAGGMGVIYKFDPTDNTYHNMYDFTSASGGGAFGGFVELPDGKLYGTTPSYGLNSAGTIFSFNPADTTLAVLHNFQAIDGQPALYGNLIYNSTDGLLYGVTSYYGGTAPNIIYTIDPLTSNFNTVYTFDSIGYYATAGLVQAANGMMYGATTSGGSYGMGVLYSFNPSTHGFTKLHDFGVGGGSPMRTLTIGSNGKIYGSCQQGGANGCGSLFSYDLTSSTFTDLFDFDNYLSGCGPQCVLTEVGATEQTAVAEISNTKSLSVYPNPVSESFVIRNSSLAATHGASVTITDLFGRVVLTQYALPNARYNIAHLPAGVYFVELSNGNETKSGRFVKE